MAPTPLGVFDTLPYLLIIRYGLDLAFDAAPRFGLKKQEDIWQCPCVTDLCNEGERLGMRSN